MTRKGIWIDRDKAHLVTLRNDSEELITIFSNIEHFRPHGGSGTRLKGGPQDVVQDSKYLERELHQLSEFFKDVVKSIEGADAIVIFGPAQTGEKLNHELSEKHSQLYSKMKSVEKADSMTDNQLKAWVRDYYHSNK